MREVLSIDIFQEKIGKTFVYKPSCAIYTKFIEAYNPQNFDALFLKNALFSQKDYVICKIMQIFSLNKLSTNRFSIKVNLVLIRNKK